MRVEAYAKINLSLRVRRRGASGLHPIYSIAQTVDWADLVEAVPADEDSFAVEGESVPDDADNLALRALTAVREATGRHPATALRLGKRIPVAAGLGGGSSDAAAVLALAAASLRLDPRARDELAPRLGSDVRLFLTGGLMVLENTGDRVRRLGPPLGAHAAVVVPPFPLETAEVYRNWDRLDGPSGPETPRRDTPPQLRGFGPLANDLTPAAVDLVPGLGDWIADIGKRWGVTVALSGSGPALYGLFPTRAEADEAAAAVPGTRAARGCSPTDAGRREIPDPPGG